MNPLKKILLITGAILFMAGMSLKTLDGVSTTSRLLFVFGLVILVPGLFIKDKKKKDNEIQ